MSRIGKRAVAIPSGVTANVDGQTVKMKGPKGNLELVLPGEVVAKLDKGSIKVDPRNETKRARSMWGTSRTLVSNLVAGVTKGFERKLEITGVVYPIPAGSTVATPKPTEVVISGIDRQKVGQVAAEIRSFRPPEPYKGK